MLPYGQIIYFGGGAENSNKVSLLSFTGNQQRKDISRSSAVLSSPTIMSHIEVTGVGVPCKRVSSTAVAFAGGRYE